jgi:hypothetical protein
LFLLPTLPASPAGSITDLPHFVDILYTSYQIECASIRSAICLTLCHCRRAVFRQLRDEEKDCLFMTGTMKQQYPVVLCPFPSTMSPYADTVQQATMSWANDFALIRSMRASERLNRLQYGTFMAWAYPTASETALKLIADWNTWLFLLDDEFDEHELGHRPQELAGLHRRLLAIMRGAAPRVADDTRYHALHDLTARFHAHSTNAWMCRFVRCVEASFAASVWEAHNRASKRIPFESEYLHMRPFTSAVFCFLTLIEIAEHITLPAALRQHPTMRSLSLMTNNVISWFNDLISYPKEIARGDVHNLVYIVHQERGISLEDAAQYVVRKHDAEVRAFQLSCAALPARNQQHARLAQLYVTGLQAWIRANVDWSIATARYQPAFSFQQ